MFLFGLCDDDFVVCVLKFVDVVVVYNLCVFMLLYDDVDGLMCDGCELWLARGDGDAYAFRGFGEDVVVVVLDVMDGILV